MARPRIDGIDISHWNSWSGTTELVDWNQVECYQLIALKATEGQKSSSRAFASRWPILKQRGTKYRGAYHWIRSDSTPKSQAEWHARFMIEHGWDDGCFTQLDWETTPGIRNVTPDEIDEFIAVHAAELGPNRLCVYGSDWVPGFVEWRRRTPDIPVWYANYRIDPNRAGNGWAESQEFGAAIWQWSSTEMVPGFQAGIDVNHVFDWSALDRICNLTTPQPPEDEVKRIVYVLPPAERSDGPHFVGIDGSWRYAISGDRAWCEANGGEVVTPVVAQYDNVRKSVFPEVAVTVEQPAIEFPEFPAGRITWES